MAIYLHHLKGCSPTPLAHYLKAIGILRIVAEQKDPEVRGYWQNQHFCMISNLDAASLETFFLNEYSPTPWISPWNKGSGFYEVNDKGLAPLEASKADRFKEFRRGIGDARKLLSPIINADTNIREIKNRAKAKELTKSQKSQITNSTEYKKELASADREFRKLKADLYSPIARTWRGRHREWFEAAMVLSSEGDPSWPALLGTGGNDGRLDFTNTAMQRLGDLFNLDSVKGEPKSIARGLLASALFEIPSTGLIDAAVGQFLPQSAGGANGTTGPDAVSRINPWDYILMLEGTIAFRGQVTRKLDARDVSRAAIPFVVTTQAVGHGTRGNEDSRGEQWMPLWDRPAKWAELVALFGEGRAQLGRTPSRKPLDFARAVANLGVARGLTGFVRYGYLTRNGQSNLAIPLAFIGVSAHPHARLIDGISEWLLRLQRGIDGASVRFSVSLGVLLDAVFDAVTREAEPTRWQSILAAIVEIEMIQANGTACKAGPCPSLDPSWLDAAADNSPEWRLALALGSAAQEYKHGYPFDSVRAHALPLTNGKHLKYTIGADKRLINDPRVVMTGRDPLNDLIALVDRRLIEASQSGNRTLPLVASYGAGANLDDLARFLNGEVDIARTVRLGRALMAINWKQSRLKYERNKSQGNRPDEAWEALRLCALPFPLQNQLIPTEPSMFRRLETGDVSGAVEIALRRLRTSGFCPPIATAVADSITARRWAAALAFPISHAVANTMTDRFKPAHTKETL